MAENNIILNRLFTQNTFSELIRGFDAQVYSAVIRRYINDPENKSNGKLLSEIYSYHEVSAKILLHLSEKYDVELVAFNSQFFKKNVVIQRDVDFLQRVLEAQAGKKTAYSLLNYLSESDQDITCFADVIKEIGAKVPTKPDDYRDRIIVKDLIRCVMQLFDRGKNEPKIRTICLDIWDELFRSNLHDIKPLADMIDNFD